MDDIEIRKVANGFIVKPRKPAYDNGGAMVFDDVFVFPTAFDLSNWIQTWGDKAMAPKTKCITCPK